MAKRSASEKPANLTAPLGLYIHIPFCAQRCPYCDFNTYAGLESLYDRTINALCAEMDRWRESLVGRPLTTIFLGGGTPTVLDAAQLTRLFEHVYATFSLDERCEISSEANPGAVDRAKFSLLRELGVNRLSMGVQSFQPEELRFLGRIHGVEDVHRAFDSARAAGFDNINLDFIFGLPHQAASSWQDTLQKALALNTEHLSLYSLIVEPDTPLHHWVQTGSVDQPDDDEAATLYEMAMALLDAGGYEQYEISNWVRRHDQSQVTDQHPESMPAYVCRHNLIYWRNQAYLGIGPGAHSHMIADNIVADGGGVSANARMERRWGNHKPVAGYVKRIMAGDPVAAFTETISSRLSMGETMMLGLRLVDEGVPFARFQQRYGVALTDTFADELAQLEAWRLIDVSAERVRLTRQGLMIGNQVFARFLPDD